MQDSEPARRLLLANIAIFFEISPLMDDEWTGIPIVAANLIREMLDLSSGQLIFFFEDKIVSTDAVRESLDRNSGLFLRRDFFSGKAALGPESFKQPGKTTVGIYPSAKRIRGLFDVECGIVHDLSTLITPHFHTQENINYHMQTIISDLRTNDLTVCVSDATREHVASYLGAPPGRVITAYNGVSWPDTYETQSCREDESSSVEPYFLILATREPRKNITRIFDMIAEHPDVLKTHRFLFTGRSGWLEERLALPGSLKPAVDTGAITFTGFVSDYDKYKLLKQASATIYPSFFEGFGLPVLESLSVGTACIASFSSSIPEVGGELCYYFDPFSVADLYRAVGLVQAERPWEDQAFREQCRSWARTFTWNRMAQQILEGLKPHIRNKARHLTWKPSYR